MVLGEGTACKAFGPASTDRVSQFAAAFRKTAFCTLPVSSRKRKLQETMSVVFFLPKITDKMLGFGSVLEGEGAAAAHAEPASGKRS